MKNAQVHRFGHLVAVALPGKGPTVYITFEEARQLRDALDACALDIESWPASESKFKSRTIKITEQTA